MSKICPICNAQFSGDPNRITCSFTCSGKWRSINNKRSKKTPDVYSCAYCHKEFEDIKERITCSKACAKKWAGICRTRERIVSPCPVCGKDVENIAGTLYPRTYCSRSCAGKVNVATSFFTTETRAKAKASLTGVPKSDAHKKAAGEAIKIAWIARKARGNYIYIHTDADRKKISDNKKRHAEESVGCRCGACLPHRKEPTQIEVILKAHLENIYPDVEIRTNEKFGRFFVDAFVPEPYYLAFEADGKYWNGASSQNVQAALGQMQLSPDPFYSLIFKIGSASVLLGWDGATNYWSPEVPAQVDLGNVNNPWGNIFAYLPDSDAGLGVGAFWRDPAADNVVKVVPPA